MTDFMTTMEERGFVHSCSNTIELRRALGDGPVTAYIGYDATAQSLHVGHLVNIMMLRWFQKAGHRPITLMGGGTTKVGDPSHRSDERPMLSEEEIQSNIANMQQVFGNYLTYNEASNGAVMRNNADWLDGLNYLSFLRDIGVHFSVNRMLGFDSVRGRLEDQKSLSFLEFNYMILQAYDFLELYEQEGCRLQMGGSDQWGNIVNGIDLARRVRGTEVFALTTPLLTKADGTKMGKTATGAIWLDPQKTPPFKFWQFWRNTDDRDVARFLKLFTELPVAECEALAHSEGAALNDAKIMLANEVTTLCHGREAARAASNLAQGGRDEQALDALPTLELAGPTKLVDVMLQVKAASSGKNAKRLIAQGGVSLAEIVQDDPGSVVELEHGESRILGVGKSNRFRLVGTAA